ncbi:MAG: tripartite tricarboxylate transporter substrate binding protein [Burkholderiaceae bacterium]
MTIHPQPGKRAFLAGTLALLTGAMTALAPMPSRAADFPVRPVTLIAPTVPGGAMDGVARLIAQHLGPRLGQPVVIENRPGVGGTLGAMQAAKASPDGHTMVIVADSYLTVSPRLLKGVTLAPFKDLSPVIEVGSSPMVLVANPAMGVKTMAEYVNKVRAEPEMVSYASAGLGSPHHLAMAILEQQLELRQKHVPYKGGPAALVDVLGGYADSMFIVMSTAEPHIKSGKLVGLGVSASQPLPDHPEIPPIAQVAPGYESGFWFAIFTPSGTPSSAIARLNREIAAILDMPEVLQKMKGFGIMPSSDRSAEGLARKLQREDAKMEKALLALGLMAR